MALQKVVKVTAKSFGSYESLIGGRRHKKHYLELRFMDGRPDPVNVPGLGENYENALRDANRTVRLQFPYLIPHMQF